MLKKKKKNYMQFGASHSDTNKNNTIGSQHHLDPINV